MLKKIFILLVSIACIAACNKKPKNPETYSRGFISIAVDESFAPIIDSQIMVFESMYPEASIHPIYTTETQAIDMLVNDSVRLVVVTRPLREQEKAQLRERKLAARETQVALDAVALIVNPANMDSLMSILTFRQILNGEITEWKEINPNSNLGNIRVVFDNNRSATVRFALDSVLRAPQMNATVFAQQNNTEVIDYVSRNPSALGVIGVNWIGNQADTTRMSFDQRVRVVAMSQSANATPANSFKPFQAYMVGFRDESGWNKYPMTRNVYIISTDPRMGLPTGFANFMASDRGQRIILKSGLVPAIVNQIRIINVQE